MNEIEKRSLLRIRNIVGFSLLIMLVFSLAVFDQVVKSARAAWEEAREHNKKLLHITGEQIDLIFTGLESALERASESYQYQAEGGLPSDDRTAATLRRLVEAMPRLAALWQVDADGRVVAAAYRDAYEGRVDYEHLSLAENALFVQIKEPDAPSYVLGRLAASREGDDGLIMLMHAQRQAGGRLDGAWVAVIDPQIFLSFFRQIEQGRYSVLSLQMLAPPQMLAQSAGADAQDRRIGDLARVFYQSQSAEEHFAGEVHEGGIARIYGAARSSLLPVAVVTILDERDYLHEWHEIRLKYIGFLGTFILFGSLLSLLAVVMARQVVLVEKSEASAVLASQAKSEFLANMSHELRTPLNAIIGFSEMMNSGYFGALTAKQKERIHDINLCGSHLLNLITDILEFSKGDAGKLELVEERVVMREIVDESLRIMHKKVKEKQINMLVEMDEAVPDLLGDKRKIRQILLNLLSNAVKFTPEKGTVKVALRQDANQNVTLTVSDTGIGIAEKDIPVALSVFGQVHRGQSHEGTGLGLPLCKMFAELHGGRLAFGSVLGEGTTVRITFPAARNMED